MTSGFQDPLFPHVEDVDPLMYSYACQYLFFRKCFLCVFYLSSLLYPLTFLYYCFHLINNLFYFVHSICFPNLVDALRETQKAQCLTDYIVRTHWNCHLGESRRSSLTTDSKTAQGVSVAAQSIPQLCDSWRVASFMSAFSFPFSFLTCMKQIDELLSYKEYFILRLIP